MTSDAQTISGCKISGLPSSTIALPEGSFLAGLVVQWTAGLLSVFWQFPLLAGEVSLTINLVRIAYGPRQCWSLLVLCSVMGSASELIIQEVL